MFMGTNLISQENSHSYLTQVIIAALNEEPGIGLTITELSENLHTHRVLVVDGNSRDRTVKIAKDCGADIAFQDGAGEGDAISKGLKCF